MKKLINLIVCAVVLLAASSCTSVRETTPVMAIGTNNIVTNVKADLDYAGVKKIQGSATTNRILWIFSHTPNGNKQLKANNKYKGLGKTESVALYRAKKSADVDVVLEPEFETETHTYFLGIFKKTKVNVTGWGANIKGFKEGQEGEQNTLVNFAGPGIF